MGSGDRVDPWRLLRKENHCMLICLVGGVRSGCNQVRVGSGGRVGFRRLLRTALAWLATACRGDCRGDWILAWILAWGSPRTLPWGLPWVFPQGLPWTISWRLPWICSGGLPWTFLWRFSWLVVGLSVGGCRGTCHSTVVGSQGKSHGTCYVRSVLWLRHGQRQPMGLAVTSRGNPWQAPRQCRGYPRVAATTAIGCN